MHQDTAGFCAFPSESFGVIAKLLLDLLAPNFHRWRQDLIFDRPRRFTEDDSTDARVRHEFGVDGRCSCDEFDS